ncbi:MULTISPECIES: chemotaxis protein CheW [Pseudoalteromonas]|uniref:Chemotaxis protein CheW n=1 Tax=Pseudoalteromonas rubra TaxID=43658 RepID=A0A0F4QZC7_9GAMM|nr:MULTISPECIES: chemotaxis protein CheW [Pseudoalteromonas]AZZ97922.1 purine-binding chemotaxis protein CheW [Pseudoalteromonas sp. R3]KJZ13068.1 chemotaxis protein CheW [Pseudoalteromonas rubra]
MNDLIHSPATTPYDHDKYLAFELNGAPYSISIAIVREIMEYIEVDKIPMAPEFIIGAINLRGLVIPVFDLSVRLNKPAQAITNRTCIIVAECDYKAQNITVGLKVDMVTKVLDIPAHEVDQVPSIAGQFHSRFVYGLAKLKDNLMTILDITKILTLNDVQLFDDLQQQHKQLSFELPLDADSNTQFEET